MQFNSYSYILLLIPAAGLFWVLPSVMRRWYVLALSIAYYATWQPAFVAVPLGLCLGVHWFTGCMQKRPDSTRFWFWSAVTFVLLIFLFFRYRQFLIANLNLLLSIAGISPVRFAIQMAVPLGISFYSFEAISYLIDAKQGRIKDRRFSNLYLFVMFWPHLMAGPIVRFRELAPQLDFTRKFEFSMLLRGLDRLILGLAQKNLLANSLGSWVDEGFASSAVATNTTLDNWMLAVCFGLQIYFDFAAYSNMAIGVAQLIGVTLPENFRFPYSAQTPPDFWNRWHMTLSRWIRDYLFFPVTARFRGAPGPLYVSLLAVMALVGLWHGSGWGFVLWGVLHGTYLVLYRIWEELRGPKQTGNGPFAGLCWRVFTLVAVTAAWVPFRAATGADAVQMLGSMFVKIHFGISYSINFYLVTVLVAGLCLAEPFLAQTWKWTESAITQRTGEITAACLFRPLIYAFGMLLFLSFDDRNTQFIYFQF